jgi:hypothetical protein
MPRTRTQKGKAWATATLVICGAFSIWANIRSGQFLAENIIVSGFPPIVAFVTSHLISLFNPRKVLSKVMIYGGFGLVCLVAMYGSGWHIYTYALENGQHWSAAVSYVLMTDTPMLLAAAILATKVPTTQTQPTPTKRTPPIKKATTPRAASPVKKATTRAKPVPTEA